MCFKPKDVPSKKVVLVELERAKVGLEQENSALKLKLRDLQASAARTVKERDGLTCQRAELESQLQQRATHASHLLTQVTCLRSDLTSRLQELLDQHLASATETQADSDVKAKDADAANTHKINLHVLQPEFVEEDTLCGSGEASAAGAADGAAAPKMGARPTQIPAPPDGTSEAPPDNPDVRLSLQQQLDRELEGLARAHQRAVEQGLKLQAQLRRAESDKAELRADVAVALRRLEQAEANAAGQQQVLQLRCAALEQENEQLTGMNQELQQLLEGAQGELSAAKKQWSSDGAQLAKQAAELEATNSRLREAEAELRALQGKLAAATVQAQDANVKVLELQEQAAARASSLDAAGSTLAARDAELAAANAELRQLREQLAQDQQARDALAVELRAATESLRVQQREMAESKKQAAEALEEVQSQLADVQSQLADVRSQLADSQRDLATAREQNATQVQALADSNAQLLESRAALTATGDRLSRALEELAVSESRAAEANSQYLTTKQSVISTAKQLASMAKDHGTNLAKLHALEEEVSSLREELQAARSADAVSRAQADASGTAAREAREAAEAAGAEARRLRAAYESASADLRRKIMLLTAIARMADKGQAGAGGGRGRDGQAADPADGYGAVVSEQRLRLKVCESPLPLLGALTAGIMDSSRLRHLALDMDTSREVTWEKAGLRICCLAAAIGLNNSLQTLQLGGWTWGELGNGTALPFLALGGGGGGGVAGGMLRSVQLATNLFDQEAAAMLKDLLAAGLVELAAGGEGEEGGGSGQRASGGSAGQGVLYLYSGNERLDTWYRDMLLLADRRAPAAAGPAARPTGPSSTASTRAGGAPLAHSLSAPSAVLSVASGSDEPRTSAGAPSVAPSASFSSGTGSAAAAAAAQAAPTGAAAAAATAVDCDLSSEALESHHMVLVMTVLLTCPDMKRLRLDGNKLGDGGAALLALGLASNTGLRELYLSRNGIRAAGARSLARCLEGANSTLLRLDVSSQRQLEGIGAAGAEAFAQALRVNRTLEDLNLSGCGLAGAAAACFAGAIRAAGLLRPQTPRGGGAPPANGGGAGSGAGGGCLRKLALSGNNIDGATAKALLAAAAERPGLALSL